MFGREPDFLHIVEVLRFPGEAIIFPLLEKRESKVLPASSPKGDPEPKKGTKENSYGLWKTSSQSSLHSDFSAQT